jgi:5-formyltetrahydrofolate cyclo-ligase
LNKEDLRRLYLQKRENLGKEEVQILGRRIADLVFSNFSFNYYQSIHIFLPIDDKNEVNTWILVEQFRKIYPHVKIIIPKVDDNNLKSFILKPETVIEKNKWGIPEPVEAEEFPSDKIDFIFVPLLAFDLRGHRVGYGKGFYDRFLKTCSVSVIKTGLSFFEPEQKIIENEFDIALDYCITPNNIYSF